MLIVYGRNSTVKFSCIALFIIWTPMVAHLIYFFLYRPPYLFQLTYDLSHLVIGIPIKNDNCDTYLYPDLGIMPRVTKINIYVRYKTRRLQLYTIYVFLATLIGALLNVSTFCYVRWLSMKGAFLAINISQWQKNYRNVDG